MKRVLHPGRGVGLVPQPLGVGLVAGEEERHLAVGVEIALAQVGVARAHQAGPARTGNGLEHRSFTVVARAPGVAKEERGKKVDLGRLRSPIGDGEADRDVVGRELGVLHADVEVAVAGKHPGVEQLVLRLVPRAVPVGPDQVVVGKRRLRVLVQILHVRVGRRRIEIEVVLLDVLPVIALAVRKTEQPLLEDRIATVPERDREAEELAVVGDAGEAVLSPTVGA